jgi:long-chain acyl-CoA synthetase
MQEGILSKMPQKKLDFLLSIPIVSGFIKNAVKKKLGLNKARFVFTGASPINPSLLHWFARLGLIIQEAYGMTENVALSHINRKEAVRFGSVGQSYKGVEVRLGKDKEVQVKSEASMLGYYKEPALSAECFEDGFLRTGDEGSIDSEGYLTITGRIKDQFKTSKGKYIMPAPIESRLLENPLLAQVCIVGSGMPSAMVVCTLSETGKKQNTDALSGELKTLLAHVNKTLEQHEHLSKIIILREEWTVANGLLTPTLKIKRKMIDAAFGNHYEEWSRLHEAVIFV